MGLSFTNIKDHPGAAVYFIHDGTQRGEQEFVRLKDDVSKRTRKQCVLINADSTEGRAIIDFYDLRGSKFVLIVRDNDQLHHVWSDGERFNASQIAYTAERAG